MELVSIIAGAVLFGAIVVIVVKRHIKKVRNKKAFVEFIRNVHNGRWAPENRRYFFIADNVIMMMKKGETAQYSEGQVDLYRRVTVSGEDGKDLVIFGNFSMFRDCALQEGERPFVQWVCEVRDGKPVAFWEVHK